METPVNNSKEACVCRNPWIEMTGMLQALQCLPRMSFTVEFIDSGVDKDGLIFGKVLYQFRKLNDGLPVNLNFPHRRLIFRRLEAALSLVVPSLAYGQCLMGKVEVFRGKSQCFRKAHPRLCYQQDKVVPIHLIL